MIVSWRWYHRARWFTGWPNYETWWCRNFGGFSTFLAYNSQKELDITFKRTKVQKAWLYLKIVFFQVCGTCVICCRGDHRVTQSMHNMLLHLRPGYQVSKISLLRRRFQAGWRRLKNEKSWIASFNLSVFVNNSLINGTMVCRMEVLTFSIW